MTHEFNQDILLDDDARDAARKKWPGLADLLSNDDVIEAFVEPEADANRLKKHTQRAGALAVILMTLALLGEIAEVWNAAFPDSARFELLAGDASEVLGVLGLVCAFLASRWGPLRRPWLHARFQTECYRQWHFRHLLTHAENARSPEAMQATLKARSEEFRSHAAKWKKEGRGKMDALREDGKSPFPGEWPPTPPRDAAGLHELADAYYEHRLEHQLLYAVRKTEVDDRTFLWTAIRDLTRVAAFFAGITLVGALVVSVAQLFWDLPWAPYTALSLAVIGVAIRAWRDGMAIPREMQHYQEIRHRLQMLDVRWKSSDEPTRFAIACELEDLMLDELRSFLQTHENAQFLI